MPLLQHRGIRLRELNSPAIRKRERSGASKASSDKSSQRSEVAHLEECIRVCEDAFQLHIQPLVRPNPPRGRCYSTLAVLAKSYEVQCTSLYARRAKPLESLRRN